MALCQRVESPRRKGDAGFVHMINGNVKLPPIAKITDCLPAEVIETLVMEWMADLEVWRLCELAAELGVTGASLHRLNVGWNIRLGCFTFPMRNADFEYAGARYVFPGGEKRSLKGGGEGLFLPLDSVGGNQLVICEGASDTASMLDRGFMAIGKPNCTGGHDYCGAIVERFKPKQVVIVCDRDKVGEQGGLRLADRLKAWASVALIQPTAAKDAREAGSRGARREHILAAMQGERNAFWEPL